MLDSGNIKALIFAPKGRDSAVATSLLKSTGMASVVCRDASTFHRQLDECTSFAVATEEALSALDLQGIRNSLKAQPSWSDLPFIVLTSGNATVEYNSAAKTLFDQLGNVTFLERPFHRSTFISVAKTALKSRQRQLETRARMEELDEGEQRLRNALLAGHLGTWELDLTTWTLSTSPAYRSLFGRKTSDPFTYQDFVSSIHPADRSQAEEGLRRSLRSASDYLAEYRNVWRDGSLHWAEFRARLVRDRFGINPRLVGVCTDITARKNSEQFQKQLNETLEQRVASRTTELQVAHAKVLAEIQQREHAEERLRQAQKMEMIGQLTGGVAHDFNNLLMVVLGSLDLLRKNVTPDPKVTRMINSATLGAQRGAALTQRLLAFARKQDLKVESQSLTDLILGATDLIERSLGSQVELRLTLPLGLPLALVDANQIELAVLNLVVNSRDAMPDGGVLTIAADQIVIGAENDLPAGRYVRLIVQDTGLGMDARTLEKATEPFFSTKEVGKGTGLGLSMVHGLAVQLNGTLRLSSVVGQGTRAELWLPATNIAAKEEPVMMEASAAQDVGKLNILVVDDDALVAMGTTDMLEDLGHAVVTAHSGDQAIGTLQEDRVIDLMITDFSMPRMNGVQLAITALKIRPNLPILLATGYAELPQGSELELPRIAKPYLQQHLAEEIAKLLKAKSTV